MVDNMRFYRIVNSNGFKSEWMVCDLTIGDMEMIYNSVIMLTPDAQFQIEWKDVE